jgi:protein-disulfide isomerase
VQTAVPEAMKELSTVKKCAWVCLAISASLFALAFPAMNAYASMEWKVVQQLRLTEKPRAVAASFSGEYLYVLVEGKLIVYSLLENKTKYTFSVDNSLDMMTLSNADNFLVLTSTSEKVVKIVQLEFLSQIDTSGLPYKGPNNAPVTIVAFIDYQCSHCGEVLPIFQQLLDKNENKLKIVFKNFPPGPHQVSFTAATAALAANEQNRFWEYQEKLFADAGSLDENKIQALARDLGLDMEKFKADMQRSDIEDLVRRDVKEGLVLGVSDIPAVFVNGRKVGDLNLQNLQQSIDSEIQRIADEVKEGEGK